MKNAKTMALGMCMLTLVSGFSFTSCSTKQGTGTLVGTGAGAALGSIIGAIAGHGKGAAIGAAIGGAVGAGAGTLIGRHMDKVAEEAKKVENAKVETVTDSNGLKAVKVTFDNGILFKVGKYDLQSGAIKDLTQFSSVLKNNPTCSVDIQGYASSDGSDDVNLKLSQNRANAVRNFLVNNCAVPSSQIKNYAGYGETNLITNADGTENRAASRRVEVYLYASQAMVDAANNGTLK
jgi:outer membrane protein OmpA-like peptidoglycan-associated protein